MTRFVAIVPVKPPARGKSRLLGLPDDVRRDLAAAFALDTVTACHAAERVAQVLVVTDDADFSRDLTSSGAHAVPDGNPGDLNLTLRLAAAEAQRRWPDLRPVALCADLPSLRAADLDAALDQAAAHPVAFVADRDGTGTTLYSATYAGFRPAFGPGSRGAHADSGAVEVAAGQASVRHDVDDVEDLRDAIELGVGAHTHRRAALLSEGGPSEQG